ncbi:MAG: hypothetical protein A2Y40_02190 [Candidatus Margulisbacteria bacterium GWF2_35_9]|nr:MAG: hypothetical protein A2Y40_02190 [Candidatus Margulisbacteria bacterium GWF2_35_9]
MIKKVIALIKDTNHQILMDTLPFLVCKFKRNGTITYVNKTCLLFHQKEEQDVLGSNRLFFVHETEQKKVLKGFSSIKSSSDEYKFEETVLGSNGTEYSLEWILKGIFSRTGKFIEFVAIGTDVTKRKQIENIALNRTQLIEALLNNSHLGFAINDISTGRVLFINQAFKRAYKVPDSACKSVSDFISYVYQNRMNSYGKKIYDDILSANPTRMNWQNIPIIDHDGTVSYISAMNIPITTQGLMISTVWDVTEHKLAEEALKISEIKFREIFENVPIPYYEVSLDGKLLAISPAIKRISNYTEEELIGMSLINLYANPIEREQFLKELFSKKELNDYEIQLKDKDGVIKPVSLYVKLISDENGVPTKIIGSMLDISERKEMEKLMRAADKMDSLDLLVGGLAHDMNNILSVVIGISELGKFANTESDENLTRFIQINQAGKRAADIISQLLAYNKPADEINLKLININKLIKNTVTYIHERFKSVKTVCKLDNNQLPVKGNLKSLERVLLNIIMNATQAMTDTPLKNLTFTTHNIELTQATVQGHTELAPGKYCVISITDTGSGIPKKDLEKIFTPYFTTKEKGTGLGMHVVNNIVTKQHNGAISIKSEVGIGTTVSIFLPTVIP